MQKSTIPQPTAQSQNALEPTPEAPKTRKHEGWRSVISTLLILIAAPLIALFLTAFVFQSYEVDGESMETTLQDHDRLIVLKLGKSWARLSHKDFVPPRGEIVVFEKDGLYQFGGGERQLIKRVIGLPGERVVVQDGIITVYNDEFPNGFRPDTLEDHGAAAQTTVGNIDVVVPEGHVFVCGDNRGNSLDSRNFGPLSTDDIVGTLVLRIFPLDKVDNY